MKFMAVRRLVEAGRLLGIPGQDHVIIGSAGFVSMADEGLLNF
jgi:DNA repair protein RadC